MIRFFICFLLFSNELISQDKITVVGNSEQSINYHSIVVNFKIQELPPDEYRSFKGKNIEIILGELRTQLELLNLSIDQCKERVITSYDRYNSNKAKFISYTLELSDLILAKKVANLSVDGFSVESLKYKFQGLTSKQEEELVNNAIISAKKKAEYISSKYNRKLGSVISIEDRSGNYSRGNTEWDSPSWNVKSEIVVAYILQ